MLYYYLWTVLSFGYAAVFRRFYIVNRHYFPTKGPVLLCPNHVNAFMDAIVIAASSKRSINFLTRGDVFANKIAAFFLTALHQVPIFRQRDGMEALKNNEETFKEVFKRLSENRVILIFPEGDCIQRKGLRTPLKKGTARMAFDFMVKTNWQQPLQVLPCGNNYSSPSNFNSDCTLVFNEPIQLMDFKSIYEENPNKAIKLFNEKLQASMSAAQVELPNEHYSAYELAFEIVESNFKATAVWLSAADQKFKYEKNAMKAFVDRADDAIIQKLEQAKNVMSSFKIRTAFFSQNSLATWKYLWLCFFAPTAALLYIAHWPFFKVATNFANKKVKNIEFYFSVRFGMLTVIYTLLLPVLLLALTISMGLIWATVLVAAYYFGGILLSWWLRDIRFLRGKARFNRLDAEIKDKLISLRNEVLQRAQVI